MRQRRIGFVLGMVSSFLTVLTLVYVIYAFDERNRNGGAFGVVLALVMFGLPAAASAWLARGFWRAQ